MTFRSIPTASFLTFILLAVLGTSLILYATPQGLGLLDDSIAYIAGARSILDGNGYREAWLASNQPVTHFPPIFSSVLALVGLTGLDPLRGTRFVNAILFGANIFLLGIIGWKMTKSQIWGIALSILFLVNYSLFRLHTFAMSEPLYIFFTLVSFLTFYYYIVLNQKKWLIIIGVLVGLTYLTRYAGLALFATYLVSLFIFHDSLKVRIQNIFIFLVSFLPFPLAWSIRNQLVADNATNRTLVYHPITQENIKIGIANFAEFLLPFENFRRELVKTEFVFQFIIWGLGIVLLVWLAKKAWKKINQPTTETEVLSLISVLYIFGYLASIVSSMLLFDASTKFQLRILSPLFVSILIIAIYFLNELSQKQKYLSAFFFLLFGAVSIYGVNITLTELRKGGQGYASFQWFDSQAMDFLQNLPEGTKIYSNEVPAVYLYTNRSGYVLPDLVDPVTGQERGGFESGVESLQAEVLSGEAVLALFDVNKDASTNAVYQIISEGLHLAFNKQNDEVYTSQP